MRRAPPLQLRLLRGWFAVASRVAPGMAERQAARLVLTPRRRAPRVPAIPGLAARAHTLTVHGASLAGWSWGSGPTVLLVHGWSGRAADLSSLADAVVRAGYRAVAFDMPAHGHSSGRWTSLAEWRRILPELARQVASGMDAQASTATAPPLHAVVAHSFGGTATVLALAAGLQARGVVLLAPALGPQAYLDRLRSHLGLPAARAAGLERALVRMVGTELRHFDAARAAAALDTPAHLLHDPDDAEVPWAHVADIAAGWTNSRLERVADVGHYGILTADTVTARVARLVAGFGAPAAGRAEPCPSLR